MEQFIEQESFKKSLQFKRKLQNIKNDTSFSEKEYVFCFSHSKAQSKTYAKNYLSPYRAEIIFSGRSVSMPKNLSKLFMKQTFYGKCGNKVFEQKRYYFVTIIRFYGISRELYSFLDHRLVPFITFKAV